MLKTRLYDEVIRIDSARTIAAKGYYWTTAYWVDGLLVDTGCAHSALEFSEILKNKQLKYIINTHSHEDHIGANRILQEQWKGLKIYAHPLALPVLANPRQNQPLQLYRRVFWGWPESSTGQPLSNGDWIEAGKYRFQVIYTPGHSPDHLCLYEQNRGWLFTGDLFIGGRDRALRMGYNIWQIIKSLKRIAQLPITRLFPGCARVRDNPNQELMDKIAYLEETGEKILVLRKSGMGVGAIARSIFGGPMLIELITCGHFTRGGLVNAYLRRGDEDRENG